ncbi:hypothetical protein [Frisingicoccus sp.]|uniref:hypothetical protein n=1 Tax=Frisingicoccus sp. TaxID=1918627 RepID=UPI00399B26B6
MRTVYLIVAIAIFLTIYVLKNKIKKVSLKVLEQFRIVFGIMLLFYISALLSPSSEKSDIFWVLLDACLLWIPFIFLSIIIYGNREKKAVLTFREYCFEWKWQMLIVSIVFFSRIWFINSVQSWDSSEYYYAIMKACQNFNFSPSSFLKYFGLLSHPSYGYGFLIGIGEFITPGNVIGVLSVVMVLTIFASVKLFHLFRHYWIEMSQFQAFLGTILCLTFPLFWGTFSCVMPDYLMLIFFILMIAYIAEKKWILSLFWGIVLCFSKEIGIVLVAGYFAFSFIGYIFNERGRILCRIKKVFKMSEFIVGICIGFSFVIYMLFNRGISQWKHSVYYSEPLSWTGSSALSYNTFGIQKENILIRLQEYFIVDFAWIISGLLIICICVFVYTKQWNCTKIKFSHIMGIIGELVFYGVFMCIYITSGATRYNVVFCIPYIIICYVFVMDVFKTRHSYVIVAICICLFVGQSFRSIDLVTNYLFSPLNLGENKMNCIAQSDNLNPGGDYYIYNLQYRVFDKNISKMFKNIGLSETDTILVAGNSYIECTTNSTIASLNGRHMDKKWDMENQEYKNTLDESLLSIPTKSTNSLWGLKTILCRDVVNLNENIRSFLDGVQGRVIVYFSPIYQKASEHEILEELEKWFYIGERQEVETDGVKLYYYEMYKKIEVSGLEENEFFLGPTLIEEEVLEGDFFESGGNKIFKVNKEEIFDKLNSNISTSMVDQNYYKSLLKFAQEPESGTRVLRPGDTIALTVACFDEDGKYINTGYSPKGTVLATVTLGIGDVIEEIETELYKHGVGEQFEVTYIFPELYRNYPEFSGKKIRLLIQINKLESELPEINDEFIMEYLNCESIENYKNMLRESMLFGEYSDQLIYTTETMMSEVDLESSENYLIYKGSLQMLIEEYAQKCKIESDELIEQFIKIDSDELENLSIEYAKYLYKQDVIGD